MRFSFSNFCQSVRVRFAPSPTGLMHLGNVRIALYNYIFAKAHNGKFILRIEDTDQNRFNKDALFNIYYVLNSLHLSPDEGPEQGGEYGPYLQSQRLELYQDATEQLIKLGKAYRCFCTDERLNLLKKSQSDSLKYDGKCSTLNKELVSQNLTAKIPYCVRFKLNPSITYFNDSVYGRMTNNVFDNEGDFVILKTDDHPTYHLANVVDDRAMHISHVIRGAEWIISTVKHLMIYDAFGWDPPRFAHLPLIYNADGTKLSKRNQDLQINYMLKFDRYLPEALLNFAILGSGGFKKSGGEFLNLQAKLPQTSCLNPNLHHENNNNNDINYNKSPYESKTSKHGDDDKKNMLKGKLYSAPDMIENFRGLKYIQTLPLKLNLTLLRDINRKILVNKINELISNNSEITPKNENKLNQEPLIVELREMFLEKYGPDTCLPTASKLLTVLKWARGRIHSLRDLVPLKGNESFDQDANDAKLKGSNEINPNFYDFLWETPSYKEDVWHKDQTVTTILRDEKLLPQLVTSYFTLLACLDEPSPNNTSSSLEISSKDSNINKSHLLSSIKDQFLQTFPTTPNRLPLSEYMQFLRFIITGSKVGPSIPELFSLFSLAEIKERLIVFEKFIGAQHNDNLFITKIGKN